MTEQINIDRRSAALLAVAVAAGGAAFGLGAFFGGYALGERSAPEPAAVVVPTELAERTYTDADLLAALSACGIEGIPVVGGSLELIGGEHPGFTRQCVVAEMGAPERAKSEYGYTSWGERPEDVPTGGEYSWSNVHMTWRQTEAGRDLTIAVD